MRKFNRHEPLGKNGERLIWGVAIVVLIAVFARFFGLIPE
jgi:hypothetical protein